MAKFSYTAKEKTGKTIKGEIQAGDKEKALQILRQRGLFILKMQEKRGGGFSGKKGSKKAASVKLDDLVVFSRQLATLIGAGITIVNAIDTLSLQVEDPNFKAVLVDIKDAVNTGSSLSEAMQKYENIFSGYFINMIKAGESSGMIEEVLERVAEFLEKSSALQKKIKSAMVYPAIVSSMAIIITLVMILVVIPVFEDMFSSFGADLPLPTQILVNISDFMRAHFLLMVAMIVGFVMFLKWYGSTESGHSKLDSIKLKTPVFGDLLRKVSISKFTRTLGTLVKSGVPILTALEIVAKTAGNDIVERAVYDVKDNVQKGESIADPMGKSGIFPPLVTRMISVGEKSGQLENMLTKISDFYDDQVDANVEALTSLIEPIIIAFLGIVIGGIVISMFLPVFQLSTIIQF